MNPQAQAQEYDPLVFLHVAPFLQGFRVAHSSTSEYQVSSLKVSQCQLPC